MSVETEPKIRRYMNLQLAKSWLEDLLKTVYFLPEDVEITGFHYETTNPLIFSVTLTSTSTMFYQITEGGQMPTSCINISLS
jgi:hypothetical protein